MLVEVTSDPEFHSMEVTILENLNLEVPFESFLVSGHDGVNCGQVLDIFNQGDTLVIALDLYSDGVNDIWYMDGCNRRFLKYENGIVSGGITQSTSSQPFDLFKDDLLNCFDFTSSVVELKKEEVRLFPNPTTDLFQISTQQNPITSFEIFTSSGKRVVSNSLDQSVSTVEINSETLEIGIYYILIRTEKGVLTKRFLRK